MPELPVVIALTVLLAASVAIDVRHYRIPNWLSLGGCLVALAMHFALAGVDGLLAAGGGLLIMLLCTLPFFALAWLGGGDVKLIAAVGAFVTMDLALPVLFGIFGAGLITALVALARQGVLVRALKRYWAMLSLAGVARGRAYIGPTAAEQITVPYAIAIALGTVAVLILLSPGR